jgi:hypothetical protein
MTKSVAVMTDGGQRVLADVIPLRKHTKLYIPKNNKPIRLLTQKQMAELEDYLNSPRRRYRKMQSLGEMK